MKVEELLSRETGKKMFMLGNEAVVRGALEAGCDVATTYPGTPSSEIGNTLHKIAKEAGLYFEFSINENVAYEVAGAAAVSGLKAFTFFKHVGLNVAADAFMSAVYVGPRGAHVVLVADDPAMHSSQNEQDSRYYAQLGNAPMLEPVTPQECKDMMMAAFDMSHTLELPVMIRTTTRVNHVSGPVTLGDFKPRTGKVDFKKDPQRFVLVPSVGRENHLRVLKRLDEAKKISETFPWTTIEGPEKAELGIVTAGASYGYVMEAVRRLPYKVRVMRIGMVHPMPTDKLVAFMRSVPNVLVAEELEPIMETAAKAAAKDAGLAVPIHGKDVLPRTFEFTRDMVRDAITGLMNGKAEVHTAGVKMELPSRPPTLCAGCPHRGTYHAVKVATKDQAVYASDIGCYTLGMLPPLKAADGFFCMGSSSAFSSGFHLSVNQPVVGFVGDSTFYHSAIPGLINAVHNKHRFTYVILDNRTTAMTGHQPHPGSTIDGMGDPAPAQDIERIVRAIGVQYVKTVDPLNVKDTLAAVKEALVQPSVSVIISRSPCALLDVADKRRAGKAIDCFHVDQATCKKCKKCIKSLGCPAEYLADDGTVHINDMLCVGCAVCAQVCPFEAIQKNQEGNK